MKAWVIIMWAIVILSVLEIILCILNSNRYGHKNETKTLIYTIITGLLTALWMLTIFAWDNLFISIIGVCCYVIFFVSALIDYWNYKIISSDKPKDVRTSVNELTKKSDHNKKTS